MKTRKAKRSKAEPRDEHELLQQEDFGWMATEIAHALSPYWAVRKEYQVMHGGTLS